MTENDRPSREEQAQLLEQRIAESGLSKTEFAKNVLRSDPRNLRRWIARENPMPKIVWDFLVEPDKAKWP